MFKKNKFLSDNEIIAKELRHIRQKKNISLKKVSEKLNINIKYLKILESGNYEKLPPGIYGQNFFKEYTSYLGLSQKEIKEIPLKKETPIQQKKNFFSNQVVRTKDMLIIPKIVKGSLLAAVVVICFFYLGFYLKNIVSPPSLKVFEPSDNLVINDNFIEIRGSTDPEAQVSVNGEPSLISDQGVFFKKINLKKGINIVVISSKKKYSPQTIIKKQILVNKE